MAAKSWSQQREQRLVGRLRAHERAAGSLEHRLERVEVPRLVVDDQDLDGSLGQPSIARAQRYSQTRSSDSSWSVFTGLAM